MKFEEAFSTYDQITHPIDEISDLFIRDRKSYVEHFQSTFLCPECHIAPLSYNNAETPYFKSYPHASHADDCSLRQDEMSVAKAAELVADQSSNEVIQRQMQSTLSILLSSNTPTPCEKQKDAHVHRESPVNNFHLHLVSTRFPRKRIDISFRPEDFNCYKLFYGHVFVKWEKDLAKNRFRILLYHVKKEHLVCRISVTDKVYHYVNEQYKFSDERECNVVFLASFPRDSGKAYQSTYLQFSDKIIIKEANL